MKCDLVIGTNERVRDLRNFLRLRGLYSVMRGNSTNESKRRGSMVIAVGFRTSDTSSSYAFFVSNYSHKSLKHKIRLKLFFAPFNVKTCNAEFQPYFILGDLWELLTEWSVCGAKVPLVLHDKDNDVWYYVSYLSRIQLKIWKLN
uniref:Uncharacterized protein n=1 Tax=Glycine max TaxID=3847 RepID=I1J4Z9_SOYBN